MVRAGLCALEFYTPETGAWRQVLSSSRTADAEEKSHEADFKVVSRTEDSFFSAVSYSPHVDGLFDRRTCRRGT